jgi:hypothetical protein
VGEAGFEIALRCARVRHERSDCEQHRLGDSFTFDVIHAERGCDELPPGGES